MNPNFPPFDFLSSPSHSLVDALFPLRPTEQSIYMFVRAHWNDIQTLHSFIAPSSGSWIPKLKKNKKYEEFSLTADKRQSVGKGNDLYSFCVYFLPFILPL